MKEWLFIICAYILGFGVIGTMWFYNYPHSVVYACSDKESNPPDVQKLCKEWTKGQWWAQ